LVGAPEAPARTGHGLLARYSASDLEVFTEAEARRLVAEGADPRTDLVLAWELLYRLEPQLYERLASAERLHPALLAWLPESVGRIAEVGAGSGRLTVQLLGRARELVAVEPAAPLRAILAGKLGSSGARCDARILDGWFDALPLEDGWADLVVTCSAFTASPGHGGDAGLAEMERVCRPGGSVVLIWPNAPGYLAAHGYRHLSFDGEVFVEFADGGEAAEMIELFYPHARAAARAECDSCRAERRPCRVTYEELGVNAPRDLAFKVIDR
jgi:SAM-dependent methyltransferase